MPEQLGLPPLLSGFSPTPGPGDHHLHVDEALDVYCVSPTPVARPVDTAGSVTAPPAKLAGYLWYAVLGFGPPLAEQGRDGSGFATQEEGECHQALAMWRPVQTAGFLGQGESLGRAIALTQGGLCGLA